MPYAVVGAIGHALRTTLRATNGYAWPASRRAGSTAGALPMGARLRLKTLVDGADAGVRKIFRAMQTHGLIVVDNGSDLQVTGSFDRRRNNGVLNPAFALLSANDFGLVRHGRQGRMASTILSVLRSGAAAARARPGRRPRPPRPGCSRR